MQSVWGTLTIGASAVRISSVKLKISKLFFQSAPGNTGNVKIGGAGLTSDNSTPGIFLGPNSGVNADGSIPPGDTWSLETQADVNTIDASQYYVHGTHAGDLVMWSYHQN